MAVTEAERRYAALLAEDTRQVAETGLPALAQIGGAAAVATIRAYRRGFAFTPALRSVLVPRMRVLLRAAMLQAQLTAWYTTRRRSPQGRLVASIDPYSSAGKFLARRLRLTPATLRMLRERLDARALTVAEGVSEDVERKLQAALLRIQRAGLHVREGVAELREVLQAAGISARPSALEAMFRTQILLAYAAGKRDVERSPEIDEILWGFRYVTVGDTRVRPQHRILEGVTLRKTDAFWQRHYPPNGYNCRCQAIPLYGEHREVLPPTGVLMPDGTPAGAAVGFGFDPGTLFHAVSVASLSAA